MTIIGLMPHIFAIFFFAYEVYRVVQQMTAPVPLDVEMGVIIYLRMMITLFVLPAIYIARGVSLIFGIELGINFFQLKLFHTFLYILLISFVVLRFLEEIF